MRYLLVGVILLLMTSCGVSPSYNPIDSKSFGGSVDGKEVGLFTLQNKNGLCAQITNYGGRIVSLWVPDNQGHFEDVVLGYETLQGYLDSHAPYYGAVIGRYAGRIAQGRFLLDGKSYSLTTNSNGNHLHGGSNGFSSVVWDVKQIDEQTVELKYLSKDQEEGYPGNLRITVIYQLTNNNELRIEYKGTTDAATPVNLTNHSFFNLHGAGNGVVTDHMLEINADRYTPLTASLIPTGELASVVGTPLDFRAPIKIGERINSNFDQLKIGKGYDQNWVLNRGEEPEHFAARVWEPKSGRTLEVYTTEPGLQFYTSNFLKGDDIGKDNKKYDFRSALCLETQHFPDSPNQPNFPSTILKPGEEYHSVCVYRFSIH